MSQSLGARLRQRREEQGVALATIAKQTKIKQSLLEGLERDDVSSWPAGFYRRAFIRAYADAIALNADVVVREFLEKYPEPREVDVLTAMAAAIDRNPQKQRSTTVLRNVMGSALGSLTRRRRATSIADLVVTDGALQNVPIPAAPERPVAADSVCPPVVNDKTQQTGSHGDAVAQPPECELDLLDVARLCTDLGRVESVTNVQSLLADAGRMLDAIGLIVWLWDSAAARLKPAIVHGYPDKVISQFPMVSRDANNLTAAAFRSTQLCATTDNGHRSGALVVPLVTSSGCAGVLAIELRRGRQEMKSIRAVAMLLAAALAQLTSRLADALEQRMAATCRIDEKMTNGNQKTA